MMRGEIIAAQSSDEEVTHIKRRLTESDPKVNYFRVDDEGTLWFKDRLVVPKNHELRKKVFDEAHTSKYFIHPDSTKMYHDLKAQFWWTCCALLPRPWAGPVAAGRAWPVWSRPRCSTEPRTGFGPMAWEFK
jgi:hypothetical protein